MDGINTETILTLRGVQTHPQDKEKIVRLPDIDVPADRWQSMAWVMAAWGVRCVIQPAANAKADLATSIQLNSKPSVETIYKQIGWQQIGRNRVYLHAGGAIKQSGNNPNVAVRLPYELRNYNLATEEDAQAGFNASLDLINLGPAAVTWPLWAATYAPILQSCDFAVHVTGRTGTFKSELCSLFQCHYGAAMDARHLPGSWSSTANALEAQAFHAKDALFTIDDFVPIGSSWQQRAYQTSADKIIRAQGNQAGRGRLSDTAALQSAYYPRGLILSTGEDTPEGHSVRARMLIMELSSGDISTPALTKAQAARPLYSAAVAQLCQDLAANAPNMEDRVKVIRDKCLTIGHTRTPPMLGRLIATAEFVLDWAVSHEWLSKQKAARLKKDATAAILATGMKQAAYLEASDPVECFCMALRQVLAGNKAHVASVTGGVPLSPSLLGWTESTSRGDMPTWQSHGPRIGWIDWTNDELYLEANIGYDCARKENRNDLSLTKQTLFKRLKDDGRLLQTDPTRDRNTVRKKLEGSVRQVLVMSASQTLDCQEVPSDDEQEPNPTQPGQAADAGVEFGPAPEDIFPIGS